MYLVQELEEAPEAANVGLQTAGLNGARYLPMRKIHIADVVDLTAMPRTRCSPDGKRDIDLS